MWNLRRAMQFVQSVFFLAVLFSLPAQGQENPDSEQGMQLLHARLADLNSFSADFEQRLFDANGNEVQLTMGTLQATRPGKLRWETQAPLEQLIVADGEKVWLYDPDLMQVTAQPYPEELARTPALLLIGETTGLETSYSVQYKKLVNDKDEFILLPNQSDSLYTKVVLQFDGKLPEAMFLFDGLQQETRIRFSDVVINGTLDPALFKFTPPDGVDLIWNE